jgi:hypothetical protein
LSWFLREDHAKTTPSPLGTDLKVKPMLGGRLRRIRNKMDQTINMNLFDYINDSSFNTDSTEKFVRIVCFATVTYSAPKNTFHHVIGKCRKR